jgi:hypothetical protein
MEFRPAWARERGTEELDLRGKNHAVSLASNRSMVFARGFATASESRPKLVYARAGNHDPSNVMYFHDVLLHAARVRPADRRRCGSPPGGCAIHPVRKGPGWPASRQSLGRGSRK